MPPLVQQLLMATVFIVTGHRCDVRCGALRLRERGPAADCAAQLSLSMLHVAAQRNTHTSFWLALPAIKLIHNLEDMGGVSFKTQVGVAWYQSNTMDVFPVLLLLLLRWMLVFLTLQSVVL